MSNICKKHLLTLLAPIGILTLGLSACHDAYDQPESVSSEEQALLSKLQHYYDDLPGQSRSGNSISIKEIEQRHYVIVDDTVVETPQTRTLDPNSFDITRVSLNIDGKEGFAIISEDERLDHVYYFTDNGCISDTAQIEGLKWLIDGLPNLAAAEILGELEVPTTRATVNEFKIPPLVRFKWSQGYPFNILTPHCTCTNCAKLNNHNPVGATAVAMAQTIATVGKFKGTYFGSRDIDFTTLPVYAGEFSSMMGQRIAHFFHEIAICCQTQFGCVDSKASIKAAYNYLKDMGYNCKYSNDTDLEGMMKSFRNGYPCIFAGHDPDKNSTHTWVVDGFQVELKDNDLVVYSFSCNWGWGGICDGWSYGLPCITNTSSTSTNYHRYYQSMVHIYIESV